MSYLQRTAYFREGRDAGGNFKADGAIFIGKLSTYNLLMS